MSVSAPNPPPKDSESPAASKWIDLAFRLLDLLDRTVEKGLVPFVLLGLTIWYLVEREKRFDIQNEKTLARGDKQVEMLRADLKEARGETWKAIDRYMASGDKQIASVKEAVKEVRTEVKATGDAVKAAQPGAPATP